MTPDNSLPAHNAFADNDDEIDLRELFAVLWNGKLALCLILFGTLLLGVIYFIAAQPIYQADGLVQVEQDGDRALIGLIVDSVCEVLNFAAGDIEDAPDFGEGIDTPFVLGIAKYKGSVKILLKIQDVLTLQELRGFTDLVH